MPKNKLKILLVEDDEFLSSILRKKLEKNGEKVITAYDGVETIKKIKKEKPDIILLDLILPEKNGFEVLAEIKTDKRLAKIPVIILSNLCQEKDIQKGKSLGALEFYVKSDISLDEVVEGLKKYKKS